MTKIAIIKMIQMYCLIYGVDPQIGVSVAAVESRLNPNAIGVTKDVGLFQLNLKSFPEYTKEQLLEPHLNARLGIKYLAKMKKECKYKEGLTFLICYNYGKQNAKKVKFPQKFPYLKRIEIQIAKGN